ncbi:MAG: hypothetical protein COW71_00565 [Ignavibacteriales bacterium CG18_big_fil_WC_8_21_14_2_50_31_20]|nr:MAG: hypothetical protein COW71_00565 [Ignavibacteriales bacterium CG18_big_fil_WC_8_21_14_2_50_31_20]
MLSGSSNLIDFEMTPWHCLGIPTITYYGQTYNTIQIGTQCWLKENLNVGTMINSTTSGYQQTDNSITEKYCYDNNESNCDVYGGLYEWTEAMQYATTEGAQGICPTGWHIPTYAEYQILEIHVNDEAKQLLAVGQTTSATNETGFPGLLAGLRYDNFDSYVFLSSRAYFWSSTESGINAISMDLFNDYSIVDSSNTSKGYGFSVRCLKD